MTQLPAQSNLLFSAPAAGRGAPPVTQPNTMGAPVQTQLDPMAASGPGQGGAATAAGVGAAMQQQELPPGGGGQEMAMQSGQPVEQQPMGQQPAPAPPSNPAWQPGAPNQFSQSGLLYNQGQGPVTSQVPPMMVAAEYRAPEQPRSAEPLDLSLGDLELLSTGTSERFRRCYAKESDAVEHLSHTAAPVPGGVGESGEENFAKSGHAGRKSASALPRRLPAGKGLVAQHNLIVVIEKQAKKVGPDERHVLNHDVGGPMKVSAVGESGLILGERDWYVNGPEAWPERRPIGRSPAPMGHSKLAQEKEAKGLLGDMGRNAWRFGKGLAGTLAGGAGTALGTAHKALGGVSGGRLGVPFGYGEAAMKESPGMVMSGLSDMGKSVGLGGLNTTSARHQPLDRRVHSQLEEVRARPGVGPKTRHASRIGEVAGTGAATAIPAAPVVGPMLGWGGGNMSRRMATGALGGLATREGVKAEGWEPGNIADYMAGGALLGVPGGRGAGAAGQGLVNRALQRSVQGGMGGYGIGGAVDAAGSLVQTPDVPDPMNPGQMLRGTRPTNVRGILGGTGAAAGLLGAIPGVGPWLAGATLGTGGAGAALDVAHNTVGPAKAQGLVNEKYRYGVGLAVQKAEKLVGKEPLEAATAMLGMTPAEAVEGALTGETSKRFLALSQTEQQRLLGLAPGMKDMVTQTGLNQFVPEQAQDYLKRQAAKANGIDVAAVSPTQVAEEVSKTVGKLATLQKFMGDHPVIGKMLEALQGLNMTQVAMIGGAILAAITGIVTALAGKGSASAISLLGALGLGAGAYFTNPEPFKGLVGAMMPGDPTAAAGSAPFNPAPDYEQMPQNVLQGTSQPSPWAQSPQQDAVVSRVPPGQPAP